MTPLYPLLPLFGALAPAAEAQEKVNQDSLVLKDFNQRVKDYVKLHKTDAAGGSRMEAHQFPGEDQAP